MDDRVVEDRGPSNIFHALQKALTFLLSSGKLESLFCVSVPFHEVLRLRTILVHGHVDGLRESDSQGVAAVMLFLLKELKGVLIPKPVQALILAAARVFAVHSRLYVLRILLAQLPPANFELLKCLSMVLLKIHESNLDKIPLLKLGVLVGPFLIQSEEATDTNRLHAVTMFAVVLLKEHHYLFSIDRRSIGHFEAAASSCVREFQVSPRHLDEARTSGAYNCLPADMFSSFDFNLQLPGLFGSETSNFSCNRKAQMGFLSLPTNGSCQTCYCHCVQQPQVQGCCCRTRLRPVGKRKRWKLSSGGKETLSIKKGYIDKHELKHLLATLINKKFDWMKVAEQAATNSNSLTKQQLGRRKSSEQRRVNDWEGENLCCAGMSLHGLQDSVPASDTGPAASTKVYVLQHHASAIAPVPTVTCESAPPQRETCVPSAADGPVSSTWEPVPPPPPPSRPRPPPHPPPPPPPPPPLPPPPPPPRAFPPKVPPPPALPTKQTESGATKNERKPKLKQLVWDKITSNAAETVWAKTGTDGVSLDVKQLESLFSVSTPVVVKESSPRTPRQSKVHLIDFKRAHNVSIQLSSLRRPFVELARAVNEMDDKSLSNEALAVIHRTLPTKEDILLLNDYKGDVTLLADVEKYYMDIMNISRVEKRIRVCLFKQQYTNVVQVKQEFELLERACMQLRDSKTFVKILEMVLAVGNYLNENSYRGSAKGFKLDALLKLMDVRGSNKKTTLLHFVASELHKTDPQVKKLPEELKEVKLAASLSLERMQANLREIEYGLQTVDEEVSVSDKEQFHRAVVPFLEQAKMDVVELKDVEARALAKFKDLAMYLGEESKVEKQTDLFNTMRKFLNMLDSVNKEVEKESTRKTCAVGEKAAERRKSDAKMQIDDSNSAEYDSDWSTC